MSATRVSWPRVAALADRLSDRDKEIIKALNSVRLMTGSQLERLVFFHHSPSSHNHIRRRVLNRLCRLGLVATLERRIGGVRAGSNGLIYCLDRFGQRMAQFLHDNEPENRTRTPRTPGIAFIGHTLAVSEAFVSLVEETRISDLTVRDFVTEPECWWPDNEGGFIKPDALIRIESQSLEAVTWLEIDQGTEHLGRIRGKLAAYERFARSGAEAPYGLLPRVVFATQDHTRALAIAREIARQGLEYVTCSAVTQQQAAVYITSQFAS